MLPYQHLPHRHPFFLLDSAEVIEQNRLARGIRRITIDDPIVDRNGNMPQAYIIESMAQISGIASGMKGRSLFAGISDLVFSGTASAGNTLELESLVERNLGRLFICKARALVSGKIIAEGGILLHFDENG